MLIWRNEKTVWRDVCRRGGEVRDVTVARVYRLFVIDNLGPRANWPKAGRQWQSAHLGKMTHRNIDWQTDD